MTAKDSNMVDTNPESSISISTSNSMMSKSPTSVHTIPAEMLKQEFPDAKAIRSSNTTNNFLNVLPTGLYNVHA